VKHYPILKENRFFHRFELELMTQACAHDIYDVYNPSFRTSRAADKELFLEKQKFSMSVLVHFIQKLILVTLLLMSTTRILMPKSAGRRSQLRLINLPMQSLK